MFIIHELDVIPRNLVAVFRYPPEQGALMLAPHAVVRPSTHHNVQLSALPRLQGHLVLNAAAGVPAVKSDLPSPAIAGSRR